MVGTVDVVTINEEGEVAVPFEVSTVIVPVVAPDGTVVTICVIVELVTVAVVPLNITILLAATVLKFCPVIVTDAAIAPPTGVNPLIVGADGGVFVLLLQLINAILVRSATLMISNKLFFMSFLLFCFTIHQKKTSDTIELSWKILLR